MKVLFSHQNFPAQFGAFGSYLARNGWDVTFVTAAEAKVAPDKCRLIKMRPHRSNTKGIHRFAHALEKSMINGQAFANACIQARDAGYVPDVVVAHSGWGSGTFAKAVWPDCKYVAYVEWYYRWPMVDFAGDKIFQSDEDGRAMALSRNAPTLLDLVEADHVFCPTAFQAEQFPAMYHSNMTVMHDGIDTRLHAPAPGRKMQIPGGTLTTENEVVTFATRGMEPHRGFPQFMRALKQLQLKRPNLHAVIGGEDRVAYGRGLPKGESWKQRMIDELDLDLSRVHFVGFLPRQDYVRMLQCTDLHVYLTVPFVLSWSMIEAMSVGCPIVASDVAPVREALVDGKNANLVDHNDIDALLTAMERTLDDRQKAKRLGQPARDTALRRYCSSWIYPARAELLRSLVGGD